MRIHGLLVSCSLAACVHPYLVRQGDLAPLTAPVPPEQRLVVWQHAIGALLDEGYIPQVLNETAGYISAKQRDDYTEGNLAHTLAIVTISPEGTLRVAVSGFGEFRSEHDLIVLVGEVQQKLMGEILGRGAPPAAAPPVATSARIARSVQRRLLVPGRLFVVVVFAVA